MPQIPINNLFSGIPGEVPQEIMEVLLKTPGFYLERIVSGGQATPPGQWYDQETHEWVVLLSGAAALLFAGEDRVRIMRPGDYVLIPAHCRHRVEWTDPEQKPSGWPCITEMCLKILRAKVRLPPHSNPLPPSAGEGEERVLDSYYESMISRG
jgi:cupin 2 domain-containing protein